MVFFPCSQQHRQYWCLIQTVEPIQVAALDAGALILALKLVQLCSNPKAGEDNAAIGIAAIRLISNLIEPGK